MHFAGLDPAIPTPPCLNGYSLRDAAERCKKAATELGARVSKAIDDMCQSGQGDLQANMSQATSSGGAEFPALVLDPDSDEVLETGSSPSDFLREPAHRYWYAVLQSQDLLKCAMTTMPTDTRGSSDTGSNTMGSFNTVSVDDTDDDDASKVDIETTNALRPIEEALQAIVKTTTATTQPAVDDQDTFFDVLEKLDLMVSQDGHLPKRVLMRVKHCLTVGHRAGLQEIEVREAVAEAIEEKYWDLLEPLEEIVRTIW